MLLLRQLRSAVLAVPLAFRSDFEMGTCSMGDLGATLAAEHVASVIAHVAVLLPLFRVVVIFIFFNFFAAGFRGFLGILAGSGLLFYILATTAPFRLVFIIITFHVVL